ncbi:hypothetical protein P8C59_009125 [Phyllachora maydis]|uniref:RRM domain-containing protein n=1 Tax=Phyllachora maydis TaxID=1825666 RepID=A0AAD9MFW6_9PEZI|nr:hypothetical protein P8C59_009125 [Phyllachora maydis]
MAPRDRSYSRSPSRSRDRSGRYPTRSRSASPRQHQQSRQQSRSPTADRRSDHRDDYSRGRSPARRHGGRDDERPVLRDPSPSRGRSRTRSRTRSVTPPSRAVSRVARSTKVVVERLTKNVNEEHLWEIFGHYGEIEDMDLPIGRHTGTNRGTAYILYYHEADAESAISHMHEAKLDGATINVSIVLPRRKFSPSPPTARRGANFDPRLPPPNGSRRFGAPYGVGSRGGGDFGGGRGGRGRMSPGHGPPGGGGAGVAGRFGPRSDVYRPRSASRSRSPPAMGGGSRKVRSRSPPSKYSRSRSRSPPRRGGRGGGVGGRRRYDDYNEPDRRRSPSRGSYDGYNRGRDSFDDRHDRNPPNLILVASRQCTPTTPRTPERPPAAPLALALVLARLDGDDTSMADADVSAETVVAAARSREQRSRTGSPVRQAPRGVLLLLRVQDGVARRRAGTAASCCGAAAVGGEGDEGMDVDG